MSKSCSGLLQELVRCLSESDCIKVEKKSYSECVARGGDGDDGVPKKCLGLRATYAKCKLGQLDMRTRIRGNKGY